MVFWLGLLLLVSWPLLVALVLVLVFWRICAQYLHFMNRIFLEKPLFIVPRGEPRHDAERVRFPTSDGLHLVGVYHRTTQSHRKGVILFGLE